MKKTTIFLVLFIFCSAAILCHELSIVSKKDTELIAQNWLAIINKIPFKDRIIEYHLAFKDEIKSGDNLIAHVYHLAPAGHILVTPYRELNPIKSLSYTSNFDLESIRYERAVIEELEVMVNFLSGYEPGSIEQVDEAIKVNKQEWRKFLALKLLNASLQELGKDEGDVESLIVKYMLKDDVGNVLQLTNASPLLETKWDQGAPYWNLCPNLNGKRCYVGCVATAIAQILRYHKWPKKGKGTYSYYWSTGGRTLSATYSDLYDWDYMPNFTNQYDTSREKNAAAELSYEVGVSVDMNYSPDGSGAWLRDVPWALRYRFRYQYYPKYIQRYYYSYSGWVSTLKRQRDLLRPVLLGIQSSTSGHAVVMDGYLGDLVHINMGWDGNKDAYYFVDNIYGYNRWILNDAVINIIPDAAFIKLNKTSISITRIGGTANPSPRYFRIKNTGSIFMHYDIVSQSSWLGYSLKDTSSSSHQIEVSVDISNLSEGKYAGKLRIESDDAINSPQYFTVNLTILPPPIYPPLNFSGSRVENRSLSYTEYINQLKWGPNPQNKNIEKYRLYEMNGEVMTMIGEVETGAFEYLHRDVIPDEKTYAIIAVNDKNRIGEPAYVIIQ